MRAAPVRWLTAAGALLLVALLNQARPRVLLAQGPGFDSGRAFEHVRQLVAIGPRPAGSAGAAQARRYITTQLSALGLTATERPLVAHTPLGPVTMANLIARIPGARAERLILAGHYDTKLFRDISFRRRQRRRVEHRHAARAGARAEGAEEPIHRRAAVSRRRGIGD